MRSNKTPTMELDLSLDDLIKAKKNLASKARKAITRGSKNTKIPKVTQLKAAADAKTSRQAKLNLKRGIVRNEPIKEQKEKIVAKLKGKAASKVAKEAKKKGSKGREQRIVIRAILNPQTDTKKVQQQSKQKQLVVKKSNRHSKSKKLGGAAAVERKVIVNTVNFSRAKKK